MNKMFCRVGLDSNGALARMLNQIDCDRANTHVARRSAYEWNFMVDDDYLTPLTDQLLEHDFDFTEEQEQNLRTTVRELLTNARRAMTEKNVRGQESYARDRFITLATFVGNNGAVIYLKDKGPGFDHQHETARRNMIMSLARAHGADAPSWDALHNGLEKGGTGLYCLARQGNFCYNLLGNEVAFCVHLEKLYDG